MMLHAAARSVTGRRRSSSSDAYHVDNELGLYIVCDGMVGHAAGGRAARIAIDAARRAVAEQGDAIARARAGQRPLTELTCVVEHAVREASRVVYEEAVRDQGSPGMGTTMTLLLVAGSTAAVGHVGHSRLYLSRDSKVTRLSSDHTLAAELERRRDGAEEQRRSDPSTRIATRSVGAQPSVEVDSLAFGVLPGDALLLCTDGLSACVRYSEQLWPLMEHEVHAILDALVAFATKAGSEDDITVLAVRVEEDDEEVTRPSGSELEDKLQTLRASALFKEMPLRRLLRVLTICQAETYEAGAEILAEGKPCTGMFLVVRGEVALLRAGEVVGTLGERQGGGEDCLVRERAAHLGLRASCQTTLLVIRRERLRALVTRQPWLGATLYERIGRLLSVALEQARQGVVERVF